MVYDLMDIYYADNGELFTASASIPAEWVSPDSIMPNSLYSEMSNSMLAAHCQSEISNYRRGEPCTDGYGVELLRRATVQGNQEAWGWMQECLGEVVRGWVVIPIEQQRIAWRAKRTMWLRLSCDSGRLPL